MLLEMMDSKLEVESTYGKGSNFHFMIRQKIVDKSPLGNYEIAAKRRSRLHNKYHVSFVAPGASIMIVDDNVMNLAVTTGLLKPTKVRVAAVKSGAECLKLAAKQHFDVILLDHMMPVMDGIQTMAKLKKEGISVPVIALTANAAAEAKEYYISQGFVDYLSKPIEGQILEAMLVKYIPADLVTMMEHEPKIQEETI